MRHGKKVNHLGRKTAHRRAMLANMGCSLIEHKRINTTKAKAKALKQFIEPIITRSKAENNKTTEKGTHNRRIAFRNLRSKEAVTELFSTVAEKIGERPGGYTRIIKLGNRLGDNAEMAMIELVDFNEVYNAGKAKKKTTRRSRRSKSKDEQPKESVAPTETKAEEMSQETPKAETAEAEAKPNKEAQAVEKPKAETKEAESKPKAEASEKESKTEAKQTKGESEEKKDDADA